MKELHGRSIKMSLIEENITETEPTLRCLSKTDLGDELSEDSELATLICGILTFNEISKLYKIDQIKISRVGMRYGALLWLAGKKYQADLESSFEIKSKESEKNSSDKININMASVNELTNIPNLGSKLASDIIRYRESVGRISCLEDLKKIKGIGSVKLNKLKKIMSI